MSNSLWPHELQHARPPCPSPTPGVHSASRPSSQWCHPAISSSVVPFSSCPQSLPASGFFPNESTLRMRWPKYWSFSFSIIPSIKKKRNDIMCPIYLLHFYLKISMWQFTFFRSWGYLDGYILMVQSVTDEELKYYCCIILLFNSFMGKKLTFQYVLHHRIFRHMSESSDKLHLEKSFKIHSCKPLLCEILKSSFVPQH